MVRRSLKFRWGSTRMPPVGGVVACLLSWATPTFGVDAAEQDRTLRAHYRQRPPEMVVEETNDRVSGPLIDILDEAAARLGYRVQWRRAPFQRSYRDLQVGDVDVVPRVVLTDERKAFVAYLGPIGCQRKDILFLVRKGQENLLNAYEDLAGLAIGTKKDTAYFDRFNNDDGLVKILSLDDDNMSKMFAAGRFDTMIILDRAAIERALADIGFRDYTYASYRYPQRIGNYYGMSKLSRHVSRHPELNRALRELARSRRVKQIYATHGVEPPFDCD